MKSENAIAKLKKKIMLNREKKSDFTSGRNFVLLFLYPSYSF
jgi:hypothetical protein